MSVYEKFRRATAALPPRDPDTLHGMQAPRGAVVVAIAGFDNWQSIQLEIEHRARRHQPRIRVSIGPAKFLLVGVTATTMTVRKPRP